jgi:hypothetical protein
MYKIVRLLKYPLAFISVTLLFVVISSFLKSPSVYAAQCVNQDPRFVQANVFVAIEDSSGNFIKYSSNFKFNVRSFVYTTQPAGEGAPYPGKPNPLAGNAPAGAPGAGEEWINQTTFTPSGAEVSGGNTPTSTYLYHVVTFNTDPSAGFGSVHTCANVIAGPGIPTTGPAYDFTDGSNGNYWLTCIGGALAYYPSNYSKADILTAGFQFAPVGRPVDAPGSGGSWTNSTYQYNLVPSATKDVNDIVTRTIVFIYRLPPPVNESITGVVNTKNLSTGATANVTNAQVILTDNATGVQSTTTTNSIGRYGFSVLQGDQFSIAMSSSPPSGYAGPYTDYQGASGYLGLAYAYTCGTATYQLQISDNPSYPNNTGRSGSAICPNVGANDMYNFIYTSGSPPSPSCSVTSPNLASSPYATGSVVNLTILPSSGTSVTSISSTDPDFPTIAVGTTTLTLTTTGGPYTITAHTNGPASCTTSFSVNQVTKPYFQVQGGDIEAGAGYGSCTPNSIAQIDAYNFLQSLNRYTGSFGQMASIATGSVSGFNSAENSDYSAVYAAPPSSLPAIKPTSGLNFTNLDQGGGNYPTCLTDYYVASGISTATAYPSASNPLSTATIPSSGTYNYSGASTLVINATQLSPGSRIVLGVTNQNVYINGNITYSNTYTSGSTIPLFELIVSGGNIYIDPSVTNLEGVFIAEPNSGSGGTVYTCASNAASPAPPSPVRTYAGCDQNPLTLEGSLSANTIEMLRTIGDDSSLSSTTAETYLYSPEEWIPEAYIPALSNQENYQNITQLPPFL